MKTPWAALCVLIVATSCASATGTDSPEAGRASGSVQSAPAERECKKTATKALRGARVRMRIEPCRVSPGQAPEVVLTNSGDATLAYALPFRLEARTPGGWRWVNRGQAFRDPLLLLEPGDSGEPEPVAVFLDGPEMQDLDPGLYRVTKEIDLAPAHPGRRTVNVRVRFRVER